MSQSPRCQIPSFVEIGPPVLEKKIFKGFEHFLAWRPSWSCDLDHLYKLSFPFPRRLHIKFGFDWSSGFRGEEVWKCGRTTTTTDGRRTPDHGYTISSPCEPKGSGELINRERERCIRNAGVIPLVLLCCRSRQSYIYIPFMQIPAVDRIHRRSHIVTIGSQYKGPIQNLWLGLDWKS